MLSGISITQLLIVLAIVILIFGTRKLRNLGEDVGGGIRGIRDGFGGDLSDAAHEIGAVKKSLEEFQEEVKNGYSDFSNGKREPASSERSSSGRSWEQSDSSSSDWPTEWDKFDEAG